MSESTAAPPPPPASPYVTAAQISAELGIHSQTIQSYFRSGSLPGRKVGGNWTTTRAAFDAWLTGGGANGNGDLERPVVELETKS